MSLDVHKDIDGGGEYLPFALTRIRVLRASGLTYATQSFVVGGATIQVRVEGDQAFVRIRAESSGAYVCVPRGITHPQGRVVDDEGRATKPQALVSGIKMSDKGKVSAKVKEGSAADAGGVDWRSADGKRLISFGIATAPRYQTHPDYLDDGIYNKGTRISMPDTVFGACAITRKVDGASGYLYATTRESKLTEFYFATAKGKTATVAKVGQYAVPALPPYPNNGLQPPTNEVPYLWHFAPNASFAAGVLITNETVVSDPQLGTKVRVAFGTLLRAVVTNDGTGLSVAVSPEGARVGEAALTARTPETTSTSSRVWVSYAPGRPATYTDVPDSTPSGQSFRAYRGDAADSSVSNSMFVSTGVLGADVVGGDPVLIRLETRSTRTGTQRGATTWRYTTQRVPDQTPDQPWYTTGVMMFYPIITYVSSSSLKDVATTKVFAGDKELYRADYSLETTESSTNIQATIFDGIRYNNQGGVLAMDYHQTETTEARSIVKGTSVDVAFYCLDARYDAVCFTEFLADVNQVISALTNHRANGGDDVTTSTSSGAPSVTTRAVARFGALQHETVDDLTSWAPGTAIGGRFSFTIQGGGGASRAPGEALMSPPVPGVGGEPRPAWATPRTAVAGKSFVVAFEKGASGGAAYADITDKFTLSKEMGFSAWPIAAL